MNQSNPTPNVVQEASKDKKLGSKLQLISNKKYKLQQSPAAGGAGATSSTKAAADRQITSASDAKTNVAAMQNT